MSVARRGHAHVLCDWSPGVRNPGQPHRRLARFGGGTGETRGRSAATPSGSTGNLKTLRPEEIVKLNFFSRVLV